MQSNPISTLLHKGLSVVCLMILLFSNPADAQYFRGHFRKPSYSGNLRFDRNRFGKIKPFSWYAAGISYMNMSGNIEHQDWDPNGERDTIATSSAKGTGIGVAYNFFIPVAQAGGANLLAVDIGIHASFGFVNGEKTTITVASQYATSTNTYSNQGMTFVFGVPVGLQLISGGEAICDRSKKMSFTVGAGFFPMLNMGVIDNFGGVALKVPPYIKAEIGIFAGINWKLRATYLFKSPNSFRGIGENILTGQTDEIRFNPNDQLILGIAVQPFSWTWE